jgi:hypothetical protein
MDRAELVEITVRDIVLCCIVWDYKLLVFRHRDCSMEEVDIQVPAGGIDPGSALDAAALQPILCETTRSTPWPS